MARKIQDPLHTELKSILERMLDRNEEITARAATRYHSLLIGRLSTQAVGASDMGRKNKKFWRIAGC